MADIKAYKDAGVNVEAGYKSTRLMKADVKRTMTKNVLSEIGGFGGLVKLPESYRHPVLVSGTDGVGTKLMLAIETGVYDTVGIDAVAMCVNDIICQGADPLFFLDYIACGKNRPETIACIVKGVADGCVQGEMALVGGETAEMPGMYPEDEFDIAGFAVGVVEQDRIITGKDIKAGDKLVGVASSGAHSNGFSLIRKIIKDKNLNLNETVDTLGESLGQALLRPTTIYVRALKGLFDPYQIKGISHITGGGFYENIPRMLPEGLGAVVKAGALPVPPVLSYLQKQGEIGNEAMYSTFNMGIGLVIALPADLAEDLSEEIQRRGYQAAVIGEVVASDIPVDIQF